MLPRPVKRAWPQRSAGADYPATMVATSWRSPA
jgi:hypothetical protein